MDEAAVAALEQAMARAATDQDFTEAARLRDAIHALRNGGAPIAADLSGIRRQQPGAMGLGSSQQRAEPPPGWTKPTKPDPMTRGTRQRRGR